MTAWRRPSVGTSGPRPSAVIAAFRLASGILPRSFREREGDELLHIFGELHAEAVARHGRLAGLRALFAELPDLVRLAASTWRSQLGAPRRRVPQRREASMLDTVMSDIRFALRSLRRAPGFAAVAVLTLGLGVGANTAIFSIVYGVLLKPLAFAEPDRLVALGESSEGAPPNEVRATSAASLFAWKEGAQAVADVAGYGFRRVTLTGFGEPESLIGIQGAGGLFDVLGAKAYVGRALLTDDEELGSEAAVVLSYETWQRYFGDDRGVVGRTIALNGEPTVVVGVMPPDFHFPDASVALWRPARFTPEERANRDQYFLAVVARLRRGATIDQLQASMQNVAARLRTDHAQYNTGLRIAALPLRETIISDVRTRLLLLMGAVGLLLVITCANLASLLIARSAGRRREIAIRQALGAGRGRVVRQLLTESLVLSLAGGFVAVGIAQGLLRYLLVAQRETLPRVEEVGLDATVLAFTFSVSVLAGILFGLAPARQLQHIPSSDALRDGGRGSGARQTLRRTLVVAEVALAVMLLTGAGLLGRSFARLLRVDPGMRTDHLLTMQLSLPEGPRVVEETIERLRAIPGVQKVAVTTQLPLSGRGGGAWFNRYSHPLAPNERPPAEAYRPVSAEYFATVGVPLRRGRMLTPRDGLGGTPSVVVNEALARKYWPAGDPVGEEIYLGAPDNRIFDRATIVGVVGDTRDGGLGVDPIPVVFLPRELVPTWTGFSYLIRTAGDPMSVVPAVRREVRTIAPASPLRNIRAMDEILADSMAPARWSLTLLGGFATLALIMAALGVFGVLSYLVAQRTKELGIRLALGAEPGQVRRMVVGEGLRLATIGVGLGLTGALALNRVIATLLYGVTSTDPLTYAAVASGLLLIGAIASWIPAQRATRVSPTVALSES